MTRKEFAKGWLLLIAQPWGRRYADDTDIARTQSEFYYHQLKDLEPGVWWRACEVIASGSTWPSLDDIRVRVCTGSGHPGPEEAWAMVSRCIKNEALTLVWSEEMREAYGVASGIADDEVAARMAFKETYQRAVALARNDGTPPQWSISQGIDKADRERAIVEGVKQGRLSAEYAQRLLPDPEDPQTIKLIEALCPRLLS